MTNRLFEPLLDDTGQPGPRPQTTEPLKEGGESDTCKSNDKKSYRNRSGWCCFYNWNQPKSFEKLISKLFRLPDPDFKEDDEYFQANSMEQFFDLLE